MNSQMELINNSIHLLFYTCFLLPLTGSISRSTLLPAPPLFLCILLLCELILSLLNVFHLFSFQKLHTPPRSSVHASRVSWAAQFGMAVSPQRVPVLNGINHLATPHPPLLGSFTSRCHLSDIYIWRKMFAHSSFNCFNHPSSDFFLAFTDTLFWYHFMPIVLVCIITLSAWSFSLISLLSEEPLTFHPSH